MTMTPCEEADFHSFDLPLQSVQEHVKNGRTTVPERYVRFDQEPPSHFTNSETSLPTLPTVDLKKLLSDQSTETSELQKLHSTCIEWGFFQLVNHGVDRFLTKKLKKEIEKFFNLPLEEKLSFKIRPGSVEGYGAAIISNDQRLEWGDRLYMTTNPLHRRKPYLLPELPSSLRITLEAYIQELQKLAKKILGLLGKALKMEIAEELVEPFEEGMQSVRMTYYPPCPQPEVVMGLSAHSDATGITILNQVNGVDGLEIKKDGVWIPVNVHPDAFVVNIGDILEIMTNGVYRSVEHRVSVNGEKERISAATFFLPKYEAMIRPLPSLIGSGNPPLFKTIKTQNYVESFYTRKLDGKSFLKSMRLQNEEATDDDDVVDM